MKKTLVSALTTALVVGAASTTFAASNPFSDVPADHWAYDAVSQLAQDGVIEGYGDSTFQGNKNITRYEMAQMIAKAMAKNDVSAADKALIDKLAAEFSDELNNLGVRVSNLERNADMVKWNGKLEYTYTRHMYDKHGETASSDDTDNNLKFRLEPSAEVNDHWHVNARLDADTKMDKDAGEDDNDKVTLKRIWAQGDYKNFQTKLGKFELYTPENGLVFDDELSGAQVTFGNDLKASLYAGRLAYDESNDQDDVGNMQGITLQYDAPEKSKLSGGVAYYHINNVDLKNANNVSHTDEDGNSYLGGDTGSFSIKHNEFLNRTNGEKADNSYRDNGSKSDDANIWSVNLGYNFDGSSRLEGAYAQNTEADNLDHSWQVLYDYKGAEAENKGTWGAYAGYRYLGDYVSWFGTEDAQIVGAKGWEIGADYAPFKNVVATAKYFNGKGIEADRDAQTVWGRVEFFF